MNRVNFMLRSVLLLVILAVAGFGGGWAWTRWEQGPREAPLPHLTRVSTSTAGAAQLPKLQVLGGNTFDFGTMEFATTKKHAFVVKNIGTAPLTLKMLGTSCKCTLAELPNNQLQPGDETRVELEWKANDRLGPYSQTATLETNDPRHPSVIFTVDGRVIGSHLLEPSDVTFTRITSDEPARAEFRVYCYIVDQLTAPESIQWTNPELRDFFDVKFEPLRREELAQRDDQPLSGYQGLISLKPGMQLGDFRQTLTFILPTPQRPLISLELRGTVEGRASILGDERWDTEHDIWSLGEWKRGTAKRESGLTLVLICDQREALQPRLVTRSPEWIGVEFGQPQFLAERNQTHLPLTIVIPETAPSGSYTGLGGQRMGRVLLDTGLENHPKLRISLRFTID
jgi:hypothetical protein